MLPMSRALNLYVNIIKFTYIAILYFETIGSWDVNAVEVCVREEIRQYCGNREKVIFEQTLLALCTIRQK